jgi:multiple sugar transport system permease protein
MRQLEAIRERAATVPDAKGRAAPRRRAAWRTGLTSYSFILPIAVFGLLLLVYPVLYSLALSFRDATVETIVSGDMPFAGLTNYAQSLADSTFWQALENTVIFTFCSILFQFTIGFLLALFFQNRFPLKNVLIALLLVPWIIPVLTAANTFKGLFNDVGPINQIAHLLGIPTVPWLASPGFALAATIVANIWIGFPFNFILLYSGVCGIPPEIYEAARIDGASYWRRVGYITLPILKPVTVAVLMLGTIYTVKVFDLVFIMTGGGPANTSHLLSTYAYQVGFSIYNYGQASAIAIVIIAVILSLNLFQLFLKRR